MSLVWKILTQIILVLSFKKFHAFQTVKQRSHLSPCCNKHRSSLDIRVLVTILGDLTFLCPLFSSELQNGLEYSILMPDLRPKHNCANQRSNQLCTSGGNNKCISLLSETNVQQMLMLYQQSLLIPILSANN